MRVTPRAERNHLTIDNQLLQPKGSGARPCVGPNNVTDRECAPAGGLMRDATGPMATTGLLAPLPLVQELRGRSAARGKCRKRRLPTIAHRARPMLAATRTA